MKTKPVQYLKDQIISSIKTFEEVTGHTVKSIGLIRLDQPVIHRGDKTDFVDVEITIRG